MKAAAQAPSIEALSPVKEGDAILGVLRRAYTVEAELLGVPDFPPLRRAPADLPARGCEFWGCRVGGGLAAVLELERANVSGGAVIASLAVEPRHFRTGLGSALVAHARQTVNGRLSVHTGAANRPARALYEAHGFRLESRYASREGIAMVVMSC